jgi:hypothetical protein
MRPLSLFLLTMCCAATARGGDPAVEFFESRVRPLLVDKCQSCHGEKKHFGGLRLDSRAAVLKGGDTGPAATPGKPDDSLLVRAVRRSGELKMPPKEPLADDQVAILTQWVGMGLPWPEAAPKKGVADPAAQHWAFRPVAAVRPPGPGHPIDAFIDARLKAEGLTRNPPADPRTLVRRMTLDLHGLPPAPGEVEAFCQAYAADPETATRALVDRLLASPRYGERWGRLWLDIARYADTKGYVFQEERRYPYAYTYRDYVIRSFNEDKPFDRFVKEQLAADLLDSGGDRRSLAALGFLTVGRRFLNNPHDIIDDRIDVISRGFMGLTVSCARCHDHKYDPIPITDYYSLYGVLASVHEPKELPLIEEPRATEEYQKFQTELAKREATVDDALRKLLERNAHLSRLTFVTGGPTPGLSTVIALAAPGPAYDRDTALKQIGRADRDRIRQLQNQVEKFKATSPNAPARAMVVAENAQPFQPVVFNRGNPGNRGVGVPRQFLAVLAPDRKPFARGSGRLDLADAIVSPGNPLTARVFVNRVWAWRFGTGLVTTPSDFGVRSDPPSHPELLDWLADRFVKDGWSVKQLHRLMLLSGTYRQASAHRPDAAEKDPENRLLARFPRQRLDFESLRDSLLSVAGTLDLTPGGPAVDLSREPFIPRRTVYGFIDRQNLPGVFRTFDFASPDSHSPQRFATTVPQQALFLMNSPFAAYVAKCLAQRADLVAIADPAERVAAMYRLLFARAPTAGELDLGVSFVAAAGESGWERYAQALLMTNEFAFVE